MVHPLLCYLLEIVARNFFRPVRPAHHHNAIYDDAERAFQTGLGSLGPDIAQETIME